MNNFGTRNSQKNLQHRLGDSSTFINTLNNKGTGTEYVDIGTIVLGDVADDFTFAFWTKRFGPNSTSYETVISNLQDSRPRLSLYMGTPSFSLYAEEDSTKRYQGQTSTVIATSQDSTGKRLFTIYDKIGLGVTTSKIYINAVGNTAQVVAGRNTFTSGTAWTTTGWRLLVEGSVSPLTRNLDEFVIIKKSGGLIQADVDALYNFGKGQDARLVSNIASSIYMYFKFNQLYNISGGLWTSGTAYVKEEINNAYYPLVNFASPSTILF